MTWVIPRPDPDHNKLGAKIGNDGKLIASLCAVGYSPLSMNGKQVNRKHRNILCNMLYDAVTQMTPAVGERSVKPIMIRPLHRIAQHADNIVFMYIPHWQENM